MCACVHVRAFVFVFAGAANTVGGLLGMDSDHHRLRRHRRRLRFITCGPKPSLLSLSPDPHPCLSP